MDETKIPEETPYELMTSQSGESFARKSHSNVTVDRDAKHERMLRLKRERANIKRALTNVVKEAQNLYPSLPQQYPCKPVFGISVRFCLKARSTRCNFWAYFIGNRARQIDRSDTERLLLYAPAKEF